MTILVKYIPAEAITAHEMLAGLVEKHKALTQWGSVALVVLSVFWIAFATKNEGERVAWRQALLCTLAFTVWMFVVKSPALSLFWPNDPVSPELRSFVLFCSTAFLVPGLEKVLAKKPPAPPAQV